MKRKKARIRGSSARYHESGCDARLCRKKKKSDGKKKARRMRKVVGAGSPRPSWVEQKKSSRAIACPFIMRVTCVKIVSEVRGLQLCGRDASTPCKTHGSDAEEESIYALFPDVVADQGTRVEVWVRGYEKCLRCPRLHHLQFVVLRHFKLDHHFQSSGQ
ncbi:hypothetical protein BC828DRAFT_116887 [Blastocladiella britannica]|nr:hypothetical protein BC828DRAFT_116887 [Blastocladiella britannica]